jgi:nicotinate-nucleotide adenylyltransferase
VLGGTFDPVHIGHLRGALEVAEALALDELRLMPSARPPHRDTPQVSAQDRLAMVECAVAGCRRWWWTPASCSGTNRPTPSIPWS